MHRGEVWKKYKLYFIIRKSQFREHTGQETTGVKDNECVEPSTDTAAAAVGILFETTTMFAMTQTRVEK